MAVMTESEFRFSKSVYRADTPTHKKNLDKHTMMNVLVE